MATEEFVFKYNYNYYVYRKDSSGEYVISLALNGDEDYLYIWDDGISYSGLLEDRDSWDILESYKKGWVFPHSNLSEVLECKCTWSFLLCYYDSDIGDSKVFTKWEDLVPWVMKLVSLSSTIQLRVEYLGIFHNDHGRMEFNTYRNRRQPIVNMVDDLLLGR